MAGRVAGKVVLITGGASGLGAESARRLAREGASLVLTDLDPAGLEQVAADCERAGARVLTLRCDVTSEADWSAAIAGALETFGRLDVLVNSAGVGEGSPILESTLEAWRRVIAINLDGVFLGMRAAGAVMAERGGGSIINLSSILGLVGTPGAAAYCASKGGVRLLSKAAALEWAPVGVRVNSVHPGYIDTPMVRNSIQNAENGNEMRQQIISMHALGRLGEPREIAEAVVFLASDESSFMTGSEMVIDGGYTAA